MNQRKVTVWVKAAQSMKGGTKCLTSVNVVLVLLGLQNWAVEKCLLSVQMKAPM